MITLQTKSGEILLVEVPVDSYNFEIIDNDGLIFDSVSEEAKTSQPWGFRDLSKGWYELIGKFSELEDDVFEEFVKEGSYMKTFYNYITTDTHKSNQLTTSKDSFQSLCKSQGVEDDLSNYLIIKKL